jgi:uncharacterized protein YndB with AHSA1/START domain
MVKRWREHSMAAQLRVERVFKATPGELFSAWTEEDQLKQWHAPQGLTTPEVDMDLRVGGKYRICMHDPEGKDFCVSGSFTEVNNPTRLVYTWQWENPEENEQYKDETLVTVQFEPSGEGKTKVVLTHEQFSTEEASLEHEKGWTSIFNQLEQFVA